MRMEPLTIRVSEETRESLEEEAGEYDVSVSEYVRELIEKGRDYEEVERERDRLQRQLGQLIDERETTTEIVEYVEEERSWRSAPVWKRAKWWVLGKA